MQFPWGFRPPQGFVLPQYTPRAPPSVPTPKQLGYTMPGEFEQHAACWMGWPTSGYLWREGARPAQEQYAGIAKAISQFEPLKMIASPGAVGGAGRGAGQWLQHACRCAAVAVSSACVGCHTPEHLGPI